MSKHPPKKDSPKVIVTQKHKSKGFEGVDEEIAPQDKRYPADNPVEAGVNPAKHLKGISMSDDDLLEKIKPQTSTSRSQSQPESTVSPGSTIQIHKSSGPAWIAFTMAFFALAGLMGLGMKGWQKVAELNAQLDEKTRSYQAFERKMQDQLEVVDTVKTEQASQVEAFNALKQDISNTQAHMLRISGDSQWLLSEAHYLASLADERLHSTQDMQTALKQLQAAQEKVNQIGDVNLGPVRSVLLRDIDSLMAAKVIDKAKIWQELERLSQTLPQLQLVSIEPTESVAPPATNDNQPWQNALKQSWAEIKSLVRVTHYDEESFKPILDVSSSEQLLKAMTILVEQAKWALMQSETAIYQATLEQISHLTSQFFVRQASSEKVLQMIVQLKAQAIQSDLPDISNSRFALGQALSNYRKPSNIEEPVS